LKRILAAAAAIAALRSPRPRTPRQWRHYRPLRAPCDLPDPSLSPANAATLEGCISSPPAFPHRALTSPRPCAAPSPRERAAARLSSTSVCGPGGSELGQTGHDIGRHAAATQNHLTSWQAEGGPVGHRRAASVEQRMAAKEIKDGSSAGRASEARGCVGRARQAAARRDIPKGRKSTTIEMIRSPAVERNQFAAMAPAAGAATAATAAAAATSTPAGMEKSTQDHAAETGAGGGSSLSDAGSGK
jgi:hypothetical protein